MWGDMAEFGIGILLILFELGFGFSSMGGEVEVDLVGFILMGLLIRTLSIINVYI